MCWSMGCLVFYLALALNPRIKNDIILLMSVNEWLGVTISVMSIIGSFILAIRWLVKHYFEEMRAELKPNSGKSLKDQVSRLEERVNEAEYLRREMNDKIDKMYIILIDYIAGQNSKKRSKDKTGI